MIFLLIVEWLTGWVLHARVLRCFTELVPLHVLRVYETDNTMSASPGISIYFRTFDYFYSVVNE